MKRLVVMTLAITVALTGCSLLKNGKTQKTKEFNELAKLIDDEYANLDEQAIPGVVKARLGSTRLSNKAIADSVFDATTKGKLDTLPAMVWGEVEKFLFDHIDDNKYQVFQFDMPDIYNQVVYLRTEREKKEKKQLKKIKSNERVISIAGKDYALDIARDIRRIYLDLRNQYRTKTRSTLKENGYEELKAKIIAEARSKLNTNIAAYKDMLVKRLDKML